MLEFIEKEKLRIEEILKNDEEHQNKKVDYILYNKETQETNTLASDPYGEEAIEFKPQTKDSKEGYWNVPEWDYNFDYYIYNLLEENWEIGYMTPEVHYGIWNSINELYPEDIDYKEGVQKYLKYCKENNISKEYLDKQMEKEIPNVNTPDIMKYLDDLEVSDTFEYKGYFIEVDDYNLDNEDENIIQIYENEQSYIDGENIESVSLSKYGLRQNIKDYIDETYFQPEIEQNNNESKVDVQSEKAYLSFVLGYDFLQDMLKKSGTPECDTNYDFCNYVADKFLKSEEYKNTRYSTYEMLEQWLTDNKAQIQYDYFEYTGKEYETYKEKSLLLQGYRNEQPVALVERKLEENVEYVIAFNYEIKNNELSWGYGYYYDDNFDKAIKDYQKVILGGDLADTFSEKKDTLKVKIIGIDNWDRPVYQDEKGKLYKDVNLGTGCLALCTATNNQFYGEPDTPISDNINIEVVKNFNKNKNKNMER